MSTLSGADAHLALEQAYIEQDRAEAALEARVHTEQRLRREMMNLSPDTATGVLAAVMDAVENADFEFEEANAAVADAADALQAALHAESRAEERAQALAARLPTDGMNHV